VTDADTSVTGVAFQARIRAKYGVRWYHLRQRSKSFKAEAAIGHCKRFLGLALAANDKGDRNWLKHVPSVVDAWNARPTSGTDVARRDVTKANELEVVAAKLGVDDPVAHVNARLIRAMSDRTRRALGFRYAVGDRVLLANKSGYETGARLATASAGGGFAKTSVVGSYGTKVYTVSAAFLKASKTHYIMVYGLAGTEGLYYAGDLTPATFAGVGADAEAADATRQATREAKLRARAAAKRRARLARS
jgi:hypothetical protein